jgi:hypothetical protein
MPDGQLVSLSWNKAPIWGLWPDFYYCQTVAIFWYEALFLTRGRVCCLQLLLALASAIILVSQSRGTGDHILLSQIWVLHFRRLLWLAGSRWRYSTPPPHGLMTKLSLSLSLMLRPTVSRPVCLGIKHPSGLTTRFLLPYEIRNTSDSCGFVDMGRSLWREDGSLVYNCFWP